MEYAAAKPRASFTLTPNFLLHGLLKYASPEKEKNSFTDFIT